MTGDTAKILDLTLERLCTFTLRPILPEGRMRQDLWEERFTHTSQTRYSYNFATTEWSDNRMNPHNLIILAEPYTIRLHWKLAKTGKT